MILPSAATLGPICAFFASVTWAVGSTTYSKLSRTHRPFDINFTRALIALPCFLVIVLILGGGPAGFIESYQALPVKNLSWLSISVLSSYALGDLFFLWSALSLGVPGALAIASGYPVLMTLAGVAFEGESLSISAGIGVFLVVSGIILVILNDPKGSPSAGPEEKAHPLLKKKAIGVLFAVLTMFAWALNGYAASKGGAGIDPFIGNSVRMAGALLLIPVLSLLLTKTRANPLPSSVIRANLWVILLESVAGSALYVYGLSRSSIVLGGTLSSLAPMLSVPVAVALKLERFSWVRSLAVMIVVAGLSLLFR